jgi:hypothetical protein
MFEAATARLGYDRLSFPGCLRILRHRLPECGGSPSESGKCEKKDSY